MFLIDIRGRTHSTLSHSQKTITSNTYQMLTRIADWKEFSNHDRTYGSANSLESVHDQIHVLTGGNGEMSDPTVAGASVYAALIQRF